MGYNSTIITKKKNLKCGHFDFNFSKGRCKQCATIESTKKRAEAAKNELQPQNSRIFNPTVQTPTEQDIIEISPVSAPMVGNMDKFWDIAATVISKKPYCWECGDRINKSDFRSATAHIFPKSLFPSIADNEWNYLVLGARCGCHNRSHTMATFSQMSIFPVAVQRYLKFGHLITENHKYLDLFIEYANQII